MDYQINNDLTESQNTNTLLKFNELTVWKPEEKSWFHKTSKQRITIINGVSGQVRDSDFVAVIGPSGAGKTTFLAALAGKCNLPCCGLVDINTVPVKNVPAGFIEIVPQFEAFMDHITVSEHLYFMTEMKLWRCTKREKNAKMECLMRDLKLKDHGGTLIRHLSGGERRLLSMATSLMSSPKIIICDEPTTGLDAYNASLVVSVLKNLAFKGHIIICSVHQPSSDLFHEFNSIMLLADGKLLFHGSQQNCSRLFESVGLICPKTYNPADFYIRAISSDANTKDNHSNKIYNTYLCGQYSEINNSAEMNGISQKLLIDLSRPPWFRQVLLLIWRFSLTVKRDLLIHIFQLFVALMLSAIAIGFSFVTVSGTNQEGVQSMRGLLWLLISEVSFAVSYDAMWIFSFDLNVFKRELGIYSISAFYVSRFFCKLPKCVVWPLVFILVATIAVDLPDHFATVFKFLIVLIGTAVASASYGLGMGAIATSTGIMMDVMPCVDLPLFLTSGAFVRISSLPIWMTVLRYMSHFYYGMDAINNVYWRQIEHIECSLNSTNICIQDGMAVLIENGYSTNFYLQDSLGLIFVTLIWCLLGYCGLRREAKKGYVY